MQGSHGAEFAPGWDTSKLDHIFYKGTAQNIDSYSTFFDNGHRKSTGLSDFLKAHHITDLYIAGIATDYCVKYSVLDALQLGYHTHVITDACKGVNLKPTDTKDSLEEMRRAGAKLITFKQIGK